MVFWSCGCHMAGACLPLNLQVSVGVPDWLIDVCRAKVKSGAILVVSCEVCVCACVCAFMRVCACVCVWCVCLRLRLPAL